jgi:NAD+-dependent protein deacetylase sirtuin 4
MTLEAVAKVLKGRRVAVLSGAGLSTSSGIPDYRTPGRERRRPPIQHQAFIRDVMVRRRYWSRSALGWPTFRAFLPNEGHRALAALQAHGVVTSLVTQNVDRLHAKAGSEALELHGALAQVRCLACGALEARDSLQDRLLELNPTALDWAHTLLPDGDAAIPDEAVEGFVVPDCVVCAGMLKPDVVFFGDAVPPARVEIAMRGLTDAEALLVVGSSLEVFSGYRFALACRDQNKPLVLVTLGTTRADGLASVLWPAQLSEALPQLANALVGARPKIG